jgi:type II secretory pathway component PulC
MNRYQREVETMDRRHGRMMCVASFAGAAVLIMLALWGAGLTPSELWSRAAQWLSASRASPEPVRIQAQAAPLPPPLPSDLPRTLPRTESSSGTDSSISQTAQPLYLLGTSPGRHAREGTALIGTSVDNPQTYSAGALLANGAQLAEIYRDHVVLKRGEQSARLPLYRLAQASGTMPLLNDLLTVGGQVTEPTAPAGRPQALTDYLRPSPVYDGEVLTGYQVYPGQKPGVFAQLGLRAGDVITAINDTPLVDLAQSVAVLEQLLDGVAVVATVVRKNGAVGQNTRERITLDGAVIVADQERNRSAAVNAVDLLPR